jgi:CRP-like cAMP-binding protein
VGVEDLLLEQSHTGAVGVYPGAHYVVWDSEDFQNAVQMNPQLARRVILELSRRIRIYDQRQSTTDLELRQDVDVEVGEADAEMSDALYEMSFADDDEFPPHIVNQLFRQFSEGSPILKQDDTTNQLYILLSGEADVFQTRSGEGRVQIDTLGQGDMAGEMAQFDGLPRTADVVARTPVKALEFKPEDFHLLFQLHPKWSQKLMRTLSKRVEQRLSSFETLRL